MSCNREVLAQVWNVPEEEINCGHCQFHTPIINDWVRCVRWDRGMGASGFCSFWMKQVGTPETPVGTWIVVDEQTGRCSNCGVLAHTHGKDFTGNGHILHALYKRCPVCGAIMERRNNDQR